MVVTLEVPIMLLLHFLLFLVGVATTTTSSSPAATIEYKLLNVQEAIAGTKFRPSEVINHQEYSSKGNLQEIDSYWKLDILHRDVMKMILKNNSIVAAAADLSDDHSNRLKDRMKRDGTRIASLTRRLIRKGDELAKNTTASTGYGGGGYDEGVEDFGSEVVSGMDQGSGEYFVRIGVGSPPRNQYMVLDSGSDIMWVQCQPCRQCYTQSDPVFDPSDSATFAGVSCRSTVCDSLDSFSGCHAGKCHYEVSYGDGSYTKGMLAIETLTLGQSVVRNVAIGCGHMNQGLFVGAAGLLGLGGGSMSFISQIKAQVGGAFGYCLGSRGTGSYGSLVFGSSAVPEGATWVPLVRNPQAPSFYYVGLRGLGVGGTLLPISEDVFHLSEIGDRGVVMDTGTAVTRIPVPAYEILRDYFLAGTVGLPRASEVSIFDTCFDLAGFDTVRVPTVSFYFSSGTILTLPARNFLIPVDEVGTFCFAFAPTSSGLSIIGNIQQEGIQISIDGANGLLGFGPNTC